MPVLQWERAEKIERLKGLMENMHTQVLISSHGEWIQSLKEFLSARFLNNVLYAPATP
ncbi:MAG: hypothetical protein R3F37_09060 [Candidatus Competibacteraceae bacterium]